MKNSVDILDETNPAETKVGTVSKAEYDAMCTKVRELETKVSELEQKLAKEDKRYTKLFNCYAQLFNNYLDEELTREG